MKTLNTLLSEGKIKLNPAKTILRDSGRTTADYFAYKGSPIGWFANKTNMAVGWAVYPLDKADLAWFKAEKESTDNVFRVASEKGTSLVKINLKSNRMKWFDNKTYTETDKISWDKQWYSWDRMIIDNNARALKAFNTDGDYK